MQKNISNESSEKIKYDISNENKLTNAETIALIHKTKLVLQGLLNNEKIISLANQHKDFIESSLKRIEEDLMRCKCAFLKESIKNMKRSNVFELNKLKGQIQQFEEEKRKLENEKQKLQDIVYELKYDPLTKLLTRREFITDFEKCLNKFNETGKDFTLSLIDLDDFKGVNDKYGHPYGDQVLYAIGVILNKYLHSKDISIYRIGGEEFAILANNNIGEKYIYKQLSRVLKILNRKRILEEAETLDTSDEREKEGKYINHKQTFSAGIKFYNGDKSIKLTELSAYSEVDKALYKAKEMGRNNIIQIK